MSARTESLIPLRFKLLAGFLALGIVALVGGNGRKDPDTSDPDRYRIAAFMVTWVSFADTRPTIDFIYRVGTNNGTDASKSSPFVANGPVRRAEPIAMFASVRDLEAERVTGYACQAYVDGNPVHTDMQQEPGKWIRCWATVTW